jgi:hypothetical protein
MKKNKKYYVTNGSNNRVFTCSDPDDAVGALLEHITGNTDAPTRFEISPITVVSECGFLKDLLAENNWEEIDNCTYVKTSEFMEAHGYKDIAKKIKAYEETLPEDQKNLLKEM